MTSLPGFTVQIDQNPYLPVGGRDVSAVVTVTADAEATDGAPSCAGQRRRQRGDHHRRLLRVDGLPAGEDPGGPRGDVGRRGRHQGRRAVRDRRGHEHGVARLPDGRVNGGRGRAHPRGGQAGGGRAAVQRRDGDRPVAAPRAPDLPVLPGHAAARDPAHRRQEPARDARASSPRRSGLCEGSFRCDCRGVGTDWVVDELRKISTALLGTVDIVPDPAGLAADFEEMMRGAMSKQLPDVMLRVWTPQDGDREVRQAGRPGHRRPDRPPLARRRPQVGEYPDRRLGAGGEPRLPRGRPGERRGRWARRCSPLGSAWWPARRRASRSSARA